MSVSRFTYRSCTIGRTCRTLVFESWETVSGHIDQLETEVEQLKLQTKVHVVLLCLRTGSDEFFAMTCFAKGGEEGPGAAARISTRPPKSYKIYQKNSLLGKRWPKLKGSARQVLGV